MGKRGTRRRPTKKEKVEKAMREGHDCRARGEHVTIDLCIVEQTRHPGACRGCWNFRG